MPSDAARPVRNWDTRSGNRVDREGRGNVGGEPGNLENGPPGRDRRSYPRPANLHSIIRCNQIDSTATSSSFYRANLSLRTRCSIISDDHVSWRALDANGGTSFRETSFHRNRFVLYKSCVLTLPG